jgi:hypothetical protein
MSDDTDKHDTTEGILEGFEPPAKETFRWMAAPLRAWFAPRFLGEEHIDPARPSLWVGNHTIYGLIDISVFAAEIYQRHDIFLRGLADRNHFMVPGWRSTLTNLGAVLGTRENCRALMESGQHVLVFPGGGREVMKRRNERYKLIWKNRTGFARMAIRHGYPILPFASVGAEDAYDIWLDANDIMNSPIGRLLASNEWANGMIRGGEAIPPLARGLGLSPLPRPERFYFGFQPPIDTTCYGGRDDDEGAVYDLRDRVRDAIRDEIAHLQEFRRTDNETGFLRRLINRFG